MKTKHPFTRILGGVALCALAAFALSTARGQTTWYWDGSTVNINDQSDNTTTTGLTWLGTGSGAGNWDNGTVDAPIASWNAGDSAVFGGSAASETVTAGTLTIGNITFGQGPNGAGTSGTAYTISGGTITLSSGSTITANTPTTIGSVLAGSGLSLTVGGTATLTLSGANTYTGGTTINSGGALTIGSSGKLGGGSYAGAITNAGTFTYNSSAGQTLSGVISGSGALVQGSSSGTLTLTANNIYTGGTTVSGSHGLIISGAGKLGNGTYAGAIVNNGLFEYNGTNSLTFTGIISGPGQLVVNPGALGCLLYLKGANTYSGATTIAGAGQVIITSDGNLGTPPAAFTASQLVFEYGFLKASGTFTLNAKRGITMLAGQSGVGASIQVDPSQTLTLAAPIAGTALGVLFGSGEPTFGFGTNLLTANSTYTGPTGISTGRLMLGANGALPYGTTLIIAQDNGSSPPGAIFDLGGYNQTIGPLSSTNTFYPPVPGNGTGIPTIVLNGALTVLQTNTANIFNGTILGSGSLTINGNSSGKLTLGMANSYTGLTTINGGTLDGSVSGTLPGNVTANGGTLQLDDPAAMSSTATLTLPSSPAAGAVKLNFSGTQTISALYFGATAQATGTWGSLTSGAANPNAAFTGTGLLLVCPTPDQTITPVAPSVCAGATTTASVPTTPGATYSWSINNGTIISGQNSATVTYAASVNSPITLSCVVTASCGAQSPGNQNVNVNVDNCATSIGYDPVNGTTITGNGVLGSGWYLNASTNVTTPLPWPIIQNGIITTSPFTVTDPDATNYIERFYYLTNSP
jgi:autotransporter-associated beta strand protein